MCGEFLIYSYSSVGSIAPSKNSHDWLENPHVQWEIHLHGFSCHVSFREVYTSIVATMISKSKRRSLLEKIITYKNPGPALVSECWCHSSMGEEVYSWF